MIPRVLEGWRYHIELALEYGGLKRRGVTQRFACIHVLQFSL